MSNLNTDAYRTTLQELHGKLSDVINEFKARDLGNLMDCEHGDCQDMAKVLCMVAATHMTAEQSVGIALLIDAPYEEILKAQCMANTQATHWLKDRREMRDRIMAEPLTEAELGALN